MKNYNLKSSGIMSKIFSLCLAICLIATSFAAFAAEDAAVYGKDSIGILKALEIAEISEAELGETITRADFLIMMGKAAGYSEMSSTEVVFSDLPLEDAREPFLKALVKVGLVSPDKNGNIKPDGTVSMAEAAAVAVKLAGYGIVAEAKGGYPAGYLAIAKSKDLTKGLPAAQNTVITKGIAARLVENLLKADLMVQTGFGSEGSNYEEREGQNYLYTVFGVRHIENVLDSVDISRVMGENDVETFFMEIGGVEIETRKFKTEVYDYLGYRVDVYYTDEKGSYPKLVYIEKSALNSETVIDIDDIETITTGRIKYYEGDSNRSKTVSYKRNLPVLYNGVSTRQSFSASLIDGKYGNVRFVDNTGDKSFDIIFVDAYDTVVVAQVDSKEYYVYDQYDVTNKYSLDTRVDDPFTTIYDALGAETKISSIKPGDVLAVFKSANDAYQKFINAYIVRSKVSGVIDRVKEGGKFLVIDGEEYELTAQCREANLVEKTPGVPATKEFKLKPGLAVELTLDYGGRVCYAKKIESAMQFGYLAAADRDGGSLEGKLKLMIYPVNGSALTIYDVAKNVRIDGTNKSSDDTSIEATLESACELAYGLEAATNESTASMIRFSVNENNEVNIIDTLLTGTGALAKRENAGNANDCLFGLAISGDRMLINYNTIGPKVIIANNTPFMIYPGPESGGDLFDSIKYTVGTKTLLVNDSSVTNAIAYYTDENDFIANVVGVMDSAEVYGLSSAVVFAVVDEITTVLNREDGEIYEAITFDVGGGSKETRYVKPDFTFTGYTYVDNGDGTSTYKIDASAKASELVRGDAVRFVVDKDGFVAKLEHLFRVYDPENDSEHVVITPRTGSHRQDVRIIFGYVYDKFDQGIVVYAKDAPGDLTENALIAASYEDCELVTMSTSSPVYFSYEEGRGGEMVIGSTDFNGLKAYKDTGLDCSRVMIQQYAGAPKAIYVY